MSDVISDIHAPKLPKMRKWTGNHGILNKIFSQLFVVFLLSLLRNKDE